MDYFSVIVLILAIFVFMSDRKIKTIQELEKQNINIIEQINEVKSKLSIIKIDAKNMDYDEILKHNENKNNEETENILIINNKINLNENDIDMVIANYIAEDKRPCGFNLQYSYNEKKWSLKKIYVDIINYLNIFNKQELSTYGVVISNKNNIKSIKDKREQKNKKYKKNKIYMEEYFKENLITFTSSEFTNIKFTKNEIKKDILKRIYLSKLKKANISIIIKIMLLIFSGSIITSNLIFNIFNVNNNINGLILAAVIYYCYSYIIRYIYKPIGKRKVFASYIFPLYFIAYTIVSIYTYVTKVIKKVHAS